MTEPRNPRAAGAPLAILIVLGALVGTIAHQPTIGVLAGTAIGIAVALVSWWRDRARA